MKVLDLMNTLPVTCGEQDSVNRAAQLMWDHDCGWVPVVDGDNRVTGVVTDRDACMAAYTRGRLLADIPVADVMSREVASCHADDRIEAAEERMRTRRVRRLPVIDDQRRLVGVLSLNDIARATERELERSRPEVKPEAFVRTIASICEPRCQLPRNVSARDRAANRLAPAHA